MNKIQLSNDVIQYMFPPRSETSLVGYNIVAVIDGDKALLIDVAFEDYAKQAMDDLSAEGITVYKIIITHFHSDHYSGLQALPNIPFLGSIRFHETFAFYKTSEEEIRKYTPTTTVDTSTTIEFGRHKLELIPAPGHSVDTLLVKINDQFLCVADELVFANSGEQTLPYLCAGKSDAKIQMDALDNLEKYSHLTMIPGHGPAFEGQKVASSIKNLRAYLKTIIETDGNVTYEDAVKNCEHPLLCSNWHNNNCS